MNELPNPKHVARRALIVDAAMDTLKREGIAGCTVRAIAAATPFTKGTIHYYFGDVQEIVNVAYLRLTDEYVQAVERLAEGGRRPTGRFWLALHSYAEGFRIHRGMGVLWFEYTSWAVRNGYGHGVASSVEAVRAMFGRRLGAIDPPLGARATAVTRYLLGMVLDLSVPGSDTRSVLSDVGLLCDLRPPRPAWFPAEHAAVCPLCSVAAGGAKKSRQVSR